MNYLITKIYIIDHFVKNLDNKINIENNLYFNGNTLHIKEDQF